MKNIPAYAAMNAKAPLAPHTIERREPGPQDILIEGNGFVFKDPGQMVCDPRFV